MPFEYFKGDYLSQEMASFKESNNNEFYFKDALPYFKKEGIKFEK